MTPTPLTVLVTGAAGFAGAATAACLAARGHRVYGLGRRPAPPPDLPLAGWHRLDLCDPETALPALAGARFDLVVHAAALMKGAGEDTATEEDYLANVVMASTLGRLVRRGLAGALVHLSSIDVYGPPEPGTVIGPDTPPAPADWYGLSKLSAEGWLGRAAAETGIPLATLRLTQLFGPGDTGRKFIAAAIRALKRTGTVTLHGDGGDSRDYLFVADAALAVALAGERRHHGTLTVCSGRSTSLLEVLDLLAPLHPGGLRLDRQPARRPATRIVLDRAPLAAALPDATVTPLAEALARTYTALT